MESLLKRSLSRTFLIVAAAFSVWISSASAQAQCTFELGNLGTDEFVETSQGFVMFRSPFFLIGVSPSSVEVKAFTGPPGSGCMIIFPPAEPGPFRNPPLEVRRFAIATGTFASYLALDDASIGGCEVLIARGAECTRELAVPFISLSPSLGLERKITRVQLTIFNNGDSIFGTGGSGFDPCLLNVDCWIGGF
jgi:hypothetical protein